MGFVIIIYIISFIFVAAWILKGLINVFYGLKMELFSIAFVGLLTAIFSIFFASRLVEEMELPISQEKFMEETVVLFMIASVAIIGYYFLRQKRRREMRRRETQDWYNTYQERTRRRLSRKR